jgi:sugar phosphate permease
MGLPGVLIAPFGQEFGWGPAEISIALAVRLVLYGLIAPFSAALIDRYGMRRIILIAVGLICSALILALVMREIWQLILFWGVFVGLGTGLTALVLGAIVSNRWFATNRGLVVGILTASSATGQLIFLPFAAQLIEKIGWRMALVPSIVVLVVVGLLIFLLLRDYPADLGLRRFGEAQDAPLATPASTENAFERAFLVLFEAARQPVFWLLAGTFFICGLSTNGLIQTHFIPLCHDFGMTGTEAASVLALMGIFDFAGTIASGYLSDRFDNRWLLFWYYGLRGLSLLYLPYSTFSLSGLSIFAMFYGLDWIATVPPTVRLAAAHFGREKAGVVFGWVFAAHMLGAALAAFGGGLSRSLFLTYLPAFYVAGFACLIAASAALMIGRGGKPALKPAVAQ